MIFIGTLLFAQRNAYLYNGIPLIVDVESEIWSAELILKRSDNITKILYKGEAVQGVTNLAKVLIDNRSNNMTMIKLNGNLFLIRTKVLQPLIDERMPRDWVEHSDMNWSIITNVQFQKPPLHDRWVISYYLDVLRSQNRDTFKNYEQEWIDWLSKYMLQSGDPNPDDWYNYEINYESLIIYDAVIIMGGFHRHSFFITNIMTENIGYRITMTGDTWFAFPDINIPTLPFLLGLNGKVLI